MDMVLKRSSSMSCLGPGPGTATPLTPPHEHDQSESPDLRRGPWTVHEDLTLINYIADHGEGRWNSLARAAGLKRTGKSCRLRWLNYLRPDVKRGNFTADEQLLILDLHSRWGNRWSKIAQHLPGRTDNEIKNYWRTRVQKHAKQLNCDVNSKRFKDAMKYLWMPRLAERINASNAATEQSFAMSGEMKPSTVAYPENSPVSVVTSSSTSSAGSFTSEEIKSHAMNGGAEMVSCGDWMQDADHEFWSIDVQVQPNQLIQFQDQELSGWVQGFSEGVSENLWSLDDIWKMQ